MIFLYEQVIIFLYDKVFVVDDFGFFYHTKKLVVYFRTFIY